MIRLLLWLYFGGGRRIDVVFDREMHEMRQK